MGGKFKDLIGQKFGRWTVIEQVDPVNDNIEEILDKALSTSKVGNS